jgi:hypothetical protein
MLDYLGRIPELDNSDMLLQVHDIYSSLKSLQCNLMFRTPKKNKLRPENNSSLIPESMILTSCCASPETTHEKEPLRLFLELEKP